MDLWLKECVPIPAFCPVYVSQLRSYHCRFLPNVCRVCSIPRQSFLCPGKRREPFPVFPGAAREHRERLTPFSGTKKTLSRYAANSAYVWEEATMIAAELRYVDRAKGRYRYAFLKPEIHCLWLSSWVKPGGQGKPPLSGPITKGIGPLRRKKAKALGNTAVNGAMRRTTSNSPAKIRRRNCRQARHSNARENG